MSETREDDATTDVAPTLGLSDPLAHASGIAG